MAVDRIASRRRPAHLALFDATTLTARAVKEQLLERSFPIASIRLFGSSRDAEANLSEFGGEAMLVSVPDIDALGKLDIGFLCGTPEEGARYLDWAARRNFVAIDLTSAASQAGEAPLVHAAVNPHAIPAGPALIATPHPVSLFVAGLLAPLRRECGLRSASIVAFQPASQFGGEGIEELHKQTTAMLAFQDIPQEVFGRQVAFNLIPSFPGLPPAVPAGGRPEAIEREVERVIGDRFDLSVALIQAPVFHCQSVLAHVVLENGRQRDDILQAYSRAGDIQVADEAQGLTPVDRAGKSGTLVSGVQPAGAAGAFWLWAVLDDQRSGSALNAVRIAEAALGGGAKNRRKQT